MRARHVAFLVCLSFGCSTASKPPEHSGAAATTPAVPAAPQVPQDPMVLVPLEAQLVASLDVDAVERTPSFNTWRAWFAQLSCIGDAQVSWLTASTSRAVFAGSSDEEATELLLILSGSFSAADRAHALDLVDGALGGPAAARSERTENTFTVLGSDKAAAVVLEGRLLLVGTPRMVSAALARTGPTPAALYGDSEPFHRVAERLQCASATGCAIALPDSRATRMLGKQLGRAGLGSTGRSVTGAAAGLAVDVSHGLRVQLSTEMKAEADAQQAVKALNDWIWQLDVIARLAGLTDVLDEIKVSGTGSFVDMKAQLTPEALATLEARLSDMIGPGECPVQATAAPTP